MDHSKPKIFIVDDNTTFRWVLANFIRNSGEFELVGEASNGIECLSKIENLEIDVILMDINMPELNGIQTSKIINQQSRSYPRIIALTQYDEFEYVKSMIKAGAKGYIHKSDVGKQLKDAIKKVINGDFYIPLQLI
ncbi:MAG: response regulator transcription factor [Salinivirgaceae bacterium]